MDHFRAGVAKELKYYIYRLIDPRNGETFYIGKGQGDRVFQHAKATRASDVDGTQTSSVVNDDAQEDEASLKVKRITDIRHAGLEVIHIIHRHGIEDQKAAYEVEAALIDAFSGLGNIAGGHHSSERGPMHAQEINDKYALPVVDLGNEKLILININSFDHTSNEELLDRVRYAWRLSKSRAEQAKYVLATIHGIVYGVFFADKWLPATAENFPRPRFPDTSSTRIGFNGRIAKEVWEHYVGERGKRLPEHLRNKSQNPVRYHNC